MWQPIKTCPDGRVLLWVKPNALASGGRWVAATKDQYEPGDDWRDDEGFLVTDYITHWMKPDQPK